MPKTSRPRNRPNLNRVRVARVVRAARSAPLARVRPKTTIRGRGVSSASINALRRFALFPKKIDPAGKNTKWWLEGLKWVGVVVMKILMTAVSTASLEQHLQAYPLPHDHRLKGKLLAGSVPTGSIIRLAFGPEDFLGETDFIDTSTSPAKGHYRQARLEWVKVIINPTAHPSTRGGMISAALIPCNRDQMRDDFKNRESETHDLNELLKTPGVVYKSATTPTTLSYSPRPAEHGFEWLQFGCQAAATGLYGAGGDCCLYLDIGLHNLSSDSDDQSANYALATSLLDVTVEARVHMREYDEGVLVRTGPVSLTNTSTATIRDWFTKKSISLDEMDEHHGVFLHEDRSLDLDAMSI